MPSDTRERIVESARELFWSQGYASTSISDIAGASGARPGSIYHFFKTKADILDAVLDHYEAQLGTWLLDPVFARTDDPLERVFGVVETYRSFLVETRFTLGCPVGGLAVELPGELADARAHIGRIFDALADALTACLADDGLPDHDGPSPAALATLVLTVIEGGIVQARANRDIAPFDRSVACVRDYFGRLMGAATPTGADA